MMSTPDIYGDPKKLSEINAKYSELNLLLETKNSQWEALVEQIESLE